MIHLISIIIIVLLFAVFDWYHLNVRKKYIYSHASRWCLRALTVVVFSRFDLLAMLGMTLFFAATFDNTLNLMRGKELFYLGSIADWDKFWRKRKTIYITMILSLIPVSIYILWISNHK